MSRSWIGVVLFPCSSSPLAQPSWAAREIPVLRLAGGGLARDRGGGPDRRARRRDALRSEVFRGTRFEVFTPDAKVVVMDAAGAREQAPPRTSISRAVRRRAGSRVLLSVLESAAWRGIATDWPRGGAHPARAGRRRGPRGAEESIAARLPSRPSRATTPRSAPGGSGAGPPGARAGARRRGAFHAAAADTARVAVETDFEFFSLFGNAQDATTTSRRDRLSLAPSRTRSAPRSRCPTCGVEHRRGSLDQTSTICNLLDFGRSGTTRRRRCRAPSST